MAVVFKYYFEWIKNMYRIKLRDCLLMSSYCGLFGCNCQFLSHCICINISQMWTSWDFLEYILL